MAGLKPCLLPLVDGDRTVHSRQVNHDRVAPESETARAIVPVAVAVATRLRATAPGGRVRGGDLDARLVSRGNADAERTVVDARREMSVPSPAGELHVNRPVGRLHVELAAAAADADRSVRGVRLD